MIRKGRLGEKFDREIAEFTSSLDFDRELFRYDVQNSLAHAIMLFEKGIIKEKEARGLLCSLMELWYQGCEILEHDPALEDVHMAIETCMGEAGKLLQTARSRNDQVACDLRMKCREEVNNLSNGILELLSKIIELSSKNTSAVMPSYTHLQHAQITTLAHHFLAHFDALSRCLDKFEESYKRVDLCPLGAGAGTTSSFKIDRNLTSKLLGFSAPLENSLDAVSSRDFMLEILSNAALLCTELSRVMEELILWSTQEFKIVELSDEHASTSSLMPQKKNPDALEIARAKCSNVLGNTFSCFSLMRALPYSYNRDFQELSPVFFSSLKEAENMVKVLAKVLAKMKVNKERASRLCNSGYATASDLAEMLVRKNIPFREAHSIIGAVVKELAGKNKTFTELNSEFIKKAAERFGRTVKISRGEIASFASPKNSIEIRKNLGSPNEEEVKRMLAEREKALEGKRKALKEREKKLRKAEENLLKKVQEIISAGKKRRANYVTY